MPVLRERSWRSTLAASFRSENRSDSVRSSTERDDANAIITPFEHTIKVKTPPAPYVFCEEALTFIPTEIVQYFSNGDKERKLHTNTEFTPEECQAVADFIKLVERKRIPLSPFVLSSASRFLSRTKNDSIKALHLAKLNHEWRQVFFSKPLTDDPDEAHIQFLKHGIVYVCGRDKHLRPIFVVRCGRILPSMMNEKDCGIFIKTLAFYVEYVIRFMMMPGVIENFSILFDMEGFKMGWNTMKLLKQIYNVFNTHYNGRVVRFYVLNPPSFISFLLAIFRPLMTERQKQKLLLINSGDSLASVHDLVASSQLERRYGGARPEIDSFYPLSLNPGPFQPTISQGSVEPNVKAAKHAHRVLTDFNSVFILDHRSFQMSFFDKFIRFDNKNT